MSQFGLLYSQYNHNNTIIRNSDLHYSLNLLKINILQHQKVMCGCKYLRSYNNMYEYLLVLR